MEITSTHLEKIKRKTQQPDNRVNSILIYLGAKPTNLEFMLEASLEACMARLKSIAQAHTYFGYLLNRVSIEVKLYQTDNEYCRFVVLKKQRRSPEIEIIGHLEQLSTERTRMTGVVQTEGWLTQITLPTTIIVLVAFFVFSLLLKSAFPFNLFVDLLLLALLASISANIAEDRRVDSLF